MNHMDRGRGAAHQNKRWDPTVFVAVILSILVSAQYGQGWVQSVRSIHGMLRSGSEQSVPAQAETEQEELLAEDPNSELAAVNSVGQTDAVPLATHLGEWVY